jgi:hypothetical protein
LLTVQVLALPGQLGLGQPWMRPAQASRPELIEQSRSHYHRWVMGLEYCPRLACQPVRRSNLMALSVYDHRPMGAMLWNQRGLQTEARYARWYLVRLILEWARRLMPRALGPMQHQRMAKPPPRPMHQQSAQQHPQGLPPMSIRPRHCFRPLNQ